MFMRMVYDDKLAQAAYLIGCEASGEAVVIDPERDVDRYIDIASENELSIVAVAETHIHADFLSGARELAERVGARVYVSDEGDADWKYGWLDKKQGGGAYDHELLKDGDTFSVGGVELRAVHTPGHTPEHLSFVVTDTGAGADEPIGMVTGDFVFVGDLGRPDLLETAAGQAGAMEPSARRLYKSVRSLDGLADYVQLWPGHGAGSACGKALGAVPASTVGYEKRHNPAIRAASDERSDERGFVEFILSGQPEPPLYFAQMKRLNKQGPPVLGGLPIPPRLPAESVAELDPATVAIVDARPWDEYRSGHLPGSLSIPAGRHFPTDAGSLVGPDERIYLIVGEAELEEAVRDLVRIGLDNIVAWCAPEEIEGLARTGAAMETTEEIGLERARQLVGEGAVGVVDVRRANEYVNGHIPEAVNISHTRLASRMDEVPRDQTLMVSCRTGRRSAVAASYLQRAGFDVMNFDGGFEAWKRTEAPVTTG